MFKPGVDKKVPLIPEGSEVRNFEIKQITSKDVPSYHKIKSSFVPDIAAKSSNRRFSLSELVSNQLSVEKEELRRFEKRVSEVVEERLNALQSEAKENAYKEGLELGRKEAFEKEHARLASLMEGLAAVTQSLVSAKENLGKAYEKELIELSFRLAKVILHYEIKERPAAITSTIEAILERVSKEDDIRIRLSAREFEVINEIHKEIESLALKGRISFEVDHNLKAGDCVVQSLSGEIGSFIETKLDKLKVEIGNNITLSKGVANGG